MCRCCFSPIDEHELREVFEHVDELHGVAPSNLGECIASLDDDDASALVTDECVRPECSGSVYLAYLLFFTDLFCAR